MSLTLQKVKENLVLDLVNLKFFKGPLFNQENKIHNKLKLLYLGWTYIILEYSHACWEPQESTNGRVISLSKRWQLKALFLGFICLGYFGIKINSNFRARIHVSSDYSVSVRRLDGMEIQVKLPNGQLLVLFHEIGTASMKFRNQKIWWLGDFERNDDLQTFMQIWFSFIDSYM